MIFTAVVNEIGGFTIRAPSFFVISKQLARNLQDHECFSFFISRIYNTKIVLINKCTFKVGLVEYQNIIYALQKFKQQRGISKPHNDLQR